MDSKLTRRGLLGLGAGAGLAACSSPAYITGRNEGAAAEGAFAHGIASGDPATDSIILWTRVTPETDGDIDVIWEMDQDADFNSLSASGAFTTNAVRDYTVKVEATGLDSDTRYYFRFRTGDAVSATGQTKTLPDGDVSKLHFAIVSCANWEHGYFNVYDAISKRAETDPYDALIHLGDYYYEYGPAETPELADRVHIPPHEIVELSDYRTRHAQYRSDAALQSATAAMPLIAVWDDHETTNDSWKTGAENHQPETEGDWDVRRQAALRAYYEWMPIREPKAGRVREEIYRNFDFGNLASLTCVETRLTARSEPLIPENDIAEIDIEGGAERYKAEKLYAPDREMFGQDQQDFIIDALSKSKTDGRPWRLLANQVIMGRLLTPDFTPYIQEDTLAELETFWAGVRDFLTLSKYNMPVYPDSWDGYPVARENFYAALNEAGINDMLVLTGDAHEFWVNELTSEAGTKVGMELVTSSVSSKTLTAYMGEATADHNLLLTQSNTDARYYNALLNGFIDLTLTEKKASVKMVAVTSVTSREYESFDAARFTLRKSGDTIKVKSPKGLNLKQRALFHGIG
ncbi:alkaline phosphatase D family protein [Litorimonas sp. WD9-15]|uniref:alkaline phosphatase D family protein n=1 Tax=Litorimonas sp. WD9-15 TaxID=3418716 RepID=UPI003CFEC490